MSNSSNIAGGSPLENPQIQNDRYPNLGRLARPVGKLCVISGAGLMALGVIDVASDVDFALPPVANIALGVFTLATGVKTVIDSPKPAGH